MISERRASLPPPSAHFRHRPLLSWLVRLMAAPTVWMGTATAGRCARSTIREPPPLLPTAPTTHPLVFSITPRPARDHPFPGRASRRRYSALSPRRHHLRLNRSGRSLRLGLRLGLHGTVASVLMAQVDLSQRPQAFCMCDLARFGDPPPRDPRYDFARVLSRSIDERVSTSIQGQRVGTNVGTTKDRKLSTLATSKVESIATESSLETTQNRPKLTA